VLGALASLVGLWVWLRLPETLHPDYRQPIEVGPILRNMGASLRDRGSIGYVFGSALVMGAMFGYINSAQQLVGEHFGAGPRFPLLFGATALMLAIANLVNSRIVERFGARRVSHTAVLIYIVVAGFQVLLSHLPGQTLYSFMPMMAMNIALLGFIGANFGSIALQPFARIAGAAASVQAFVRMVIGAGLGIVIGQAYDDSARPLSWALLLCGLTCLALVLFSERGRLFRRLTPPGGSRPVAQP
jgi:DHA1 family bicyclomycin/chloramphenicol resistance-like MFS transporter